MPRRDYSKVAFAATGDTNVIPTPVQPDGSISLQTGWGFDYQRDNGAGGGTPDPLAKNIDREDMNGVLNEITASIGEIQQNGAPIWVVTAAPYPINAKVRHLDLNWRSAVTNNNSTPGANTDWIQDVSLTDSVRIDVASSSTVNLTVSAPETRHINITGTSTIAGFTVGAGKCYFVRFNAVLTLTNSASLVTQSGTDIITAAGDTCIIRATAANTVEILCYTTGIPQALGYRQTPAFVAKTLNTNYTNTTGRPILVMVRVATTGVSAVNNRVGIQVNGGAEYLSAGSIGAGANYSLMTVGVVPPGAVYRANINSATLDNWLELSI